MEAHIYEGVCGQVTLRGLFWIPKRYATREDLRLEQRFETPRSVERVQRAVHGDDIRVARVWTQLEAKIDEKLKFLRRLALDGGCKSLPRRLGIIIATVGRRTWLLPPRLVQRPGIERAKTRFIHEIHNDLLGPGIIARDGAGKSPWRSFRASEFGERVGQDVVECLDHRAAELLRYPDAMRHPCIDLRDLWVAQPG